MFLWKDDSKHIELMNFKLIAIKTTLQHFNVATLQQ